MCLVLCQVWGPWWEWLKHGAASGLQTAPWKVRTTGYQQDAGCITGRKGIFWEPWQPTTAREYKLPEKWLTDLSGWVRCRGSPSALR